ncbi:MAG: hypothetical protein LBH25_12080 [Fibromonadaceae bacterium]|nr:hypothetical protein [Fibromonadaceae bacterium]
MENEAYNRLNHADTAKTIDYSALAYWNEKTLDTWNTFYAFDSLHTPKRRKDTIEYELKEGLLRLLMDAAKTEEIYYEARLKTTTYVNPSITFNEERIKSYCQDLHDNVKLVARNAEKTCLMLHDKGVSLLEIDTLFVLATKDVNCMSYGFANEWQVVEKSVFFDGKRRVSCSPFVTIFGIEAEGN